MPFQLFQLPSYERCLKKLGKRERRIAEIVVRALQSYFQTSHFPTGDPYILEWEGQSHRLIFKKLQGVSWEAYIEGRVRLLTRLEKDRHILVFAGNHDQVRQFLRKN